MKQDLNGVRTAQDVVRRYDFEDIPVLVKSTKEIALEVSKKVGDDEIISKINLSPEEATIKADKIKLEGYTTINNGFSVDESGNMICNGATMNNAKVEGGTFTTTVNENGNVTIGTSTMDLIVCNQHGYESGVAYDYRGRYGSKGTRYEVDDKITAYIGSTTGAGKLHLYDSVSGTNKPDVILYGDDNQYKASMFISSSNSGYINLRDSTNTSTIYEDANNGKITCVSLTQTSKAEKKKDFEKLENALDIVKDTDIYKYHFTKEKETDKKHIGFVIGENYKYRQEITDDENNGAELYSMTSVLWKAVQEQQEIIEELKKKVEK